MIADPSKTLYISRYRLVEDVDVDVRCRRPMPFFSSLAFFLSLR